PAPAPHNAAQNAPPPPAPNPCGGGAALTRSQTANGCGARCILMHRFVATDRIGLGGMRGAGLLGRLAGAGAPGGGAVAGGGARPSGGRLGPSNPGGRRSADGWAGVAAALSARPPRWTGPPG